MTLLKRVCNGEAKEVSEQVLREIARSAEGSPRQAIGILEQVMGLNSESALEMIRAIEIGESQVIEICRALAKKQKWADVLKLLQNMEIAEPERARVSILNYLTSVFINGGNEKAGQMMEYFTETMIYSGKGGLVLAIWKACKHT